jgi:multiple sugar transport system substrate-binding protein
MRSTGVVRSALGLAALMLLGTGRLAAAQDSAVARVTLHVWSAWDDAASETVAARRQLAAFATAHPDIVLDMRNFTPAALHDRLMDAIATGQVPDLSLGAPEWLGEFARMGALMNLDAFAKGWPSRAAIYPSVLAALSVGGHLMALPDAVRPRALLYHADMLRAAGIAAPPATWEALIADAQRVKLTTGHDGFGIAATGARAPEELTMYLAQQGLALAEPTADGKYRNTWNDHPNQLAVVTRVFGFYSSLMERGAIPTGAEGWDGPEEDERFALGRIAFVISGMWMKSREMQTPQLMADVAIAPPPTGGRAATFFEVSPIFLFKATTHPQAVLELADVMTGRPYQQAVHPEDSPRRDVTDDVKWSAPFLRLASTGVALPPVAMGGISRDIQAAIVGLLVKNQDPPEVARQLGADINRDLREAGQLGGEG